MAAAKPRKAPHAKAGLNAEEKEAMKALVRERKAGASRKEGEAALLAAIEAMAPADRALAERFHALIGAHAPQLAPRTWYGMPAWAKGDEVVCFFKAASKFKERYASFGFNTPATIDEGPMWATSWAVLDLTPADEAMIVALVKKAAG